jgi:hypothetical protein
VPQLLTLDVIQQEYPRTGRTVDELSEALRKGINPLDPSQATLDFATALKKGCDWIFEYLKEYQPKAYAVIADAGSSLLVGERAWTDQIGRKRWTCGAFIRLRTKYIAFHPDFPERMEDVGKRHVAYSRYAALPEGLAKAYYARMDGIEIAHRLPLNAMESRVLPAKLSGWTRAKRLCKDRKTRDNMISALNEVADRQVPSSAVESFWVFLDSREQDNYETIGDYLLVQEGSNSQRIFHVQNWDFRKLRQVEDPIHLMDEYVAHVLQETSISFDFSPFSRPVS